MKRFFTIFFFPFFLFSQSNLSFQYLTTWGEQGTEKGQFREPAALDVDPSGFLYVCDAGNNRIQKIGPKGEFIRDIGGFGWDREQFDRPVSVWASNGLDVFVADYNNQRIERYDKDLNYLGSFRSDTRWQENLQFGYPLDVALSGHGELYLLDEEYRRVLKLDILGAPQFSFGGFESGRGRLSSPVRMHISSGRVFVSNAEPASVFTFDLYGNFIFHFGDSLLQSPHGIFQLNQEILGVVDTGLKRIQFFSVQGVPVGTLGGEDHPWVFDAPVDAAVIRDLLFVLDRKRGVVEVFRWRR